MKKEDLKEGCISMSYSRFEILTKRIVDRTKNEYVAGDLVPDFDKIIAVAKKPWDFLNYLIWYEETADDDDGNNVGVIDAVEQAWDYINYIVELHN